ncbi:hypothetical protein HY798_02110 [Candidatus Falkowbacteria bacterium]|nr:hypothetical protein [Candidatus Falkowbacteria bacterium]
MDEELKTEDVKELIKKNLELTEEIYVMTKKIKRFITFQKIMSFVYFLIIVVPIVLSIIFLPPLLKNIFNQYQSLLGEDGGGSSNLLEGILKGGAGGLNLNDLNLKNIDVNQLPPELRKMVK